ncbi:hypothetical protein SUGI_0546680 [Cryptomeria japonica]|nr:hypothetical protein SUGI_0546680 [Cryptomeria japonica]
MGCIRTSPVCPFGGLPEPVFYDQIAAFMVDNELEGGNRVALLSGKHTFLSGKCRFWDWVFDCFVDWLLRKEFVVAMVFESKGQWLPSLAGNYIAFEWGRKEGFCRILLALMDFGHKLEKK